MVKNFKVAKLSNFKTFSVCQKNFGGGDGGSDNDSDNDDPCPSCDDSGSGCDDCGGPQ